VRPVTTPRAKRFEYAVGVDRAGRVSVGGGAPFALPDEWSPEHLVLAGLWRCTVTSLRYHAGRVGIDLLAGGSAAGVVTRREEDGRYAFVELDCRIDVELEPVPPGEEVGALLAKAERDCFVGASLTVEPTYRWRVNGVEARAA
jgi:uncharacterized OsmC-like protein